jgi:pimeloyl-ACP methyl ester carboxylesterase
MVNPDVWKELGCVSLSAYGLVMPKREAVVDRGEDGYAPVVLVHGLGGNRGAWTPLRTFLRLNGHRRIYAFGFEKGTIEQHAEGLKRFIEEICEVTGEQKVDIVAHSLGGLISRYAIQRLDMTPAVRNLITLATPHLGTYAAQYANTPLTLALRPDSAIIRDLNGDDLSNLPIRFVTVSSDRDIYVIPHKGQTHPDAEDVFVPNIAHSQHLISMKVFHEIHRLCDKK